MCQTVDGRVKMSELKSRLDVKAHHLPVKITRTRPLERHVRFDIVFVEVACCSAGEREKNEGRV
jgi:hypothetical protein